MKRLLLRSMSMLFALLLAGAAMCGCSKEKETGSTPDVSVSILPQKYLVERIAGSDFRVNVLIPQGQSPATYEPTQRQIQMISRSLVYFRIGHVAAEKAQIERLHKLNPGMKLVDLSKKIKLLHADSNGHDKHGHNHKGVDPHVWLSPVNVRFMAEDICRELSRVKPEKKSEYEANLKAFQKDIDTLEKDIAKELKDLKNRIILVFHPAWGYFSRDFGLEQIAIEQGGKNPSPTHIRHIIDTAKKKNISIVFVQKQFPLDVAKSIAGDINGDVLHMNPLAENWLENMRVISKTLRKNMQ
jgi:zinc transport system substrate-binding protein